MEKPVVIDAGSGDIHLPNGFVITSSLTLGEFQRSWFGRGAAPNHPASEPQSCWFDLNAGLLTSHPVSVGLSFYEQGLIRASLRISAAYATEDSMEAGLDAESSIKSFHDALLRHDLGEPDAVISDTGEDHPGLERSNYHHLSWGEAKSTFNYGGGDSYISIEYATRRAQVREEERKRKGEQRQQRADAGIWMASVIRQINNEY